LHVASDTRLQSLDFEKGSLPKLTASVTMGTQASTCILNRLRYVSMGGRTISGETDQIVVARVLAGDSNAFQNLVERYQDRIYSAVLNYVYNPEDALDVTQDAFVKAYSNLRRFNAGSAFYTWLYRIAVNTSIDFLRKKKGKPVDSLDDERFSEMGFEPVSQDYSAQPEKVAVKVDQLRILRRAISSLSEKLRTVVVLHDVEGLSQEEVAEILKVPLGTVKSRVSRGRAELRKLLSKEAGEAL